MTLTNYWWLLIWVFIAGGFLNMFVPKQHEKVMGKTEIRWRIWSAIVLVLPYVIWAGYRTDGMGDTYNYRRAFLEAPGTLSAIGDYIAGIENDKGFYLITSIIKCIIGNSDEIYFLIIAAFQVFVVAMVIRKYSCDYWFGIFVFIASSTYFSWTHNGIRQFTAVIIIFAFTGLILQKKYQLLVVVILLAATIHASAILMLPIVFIIQGKAWNKKTVLCIIASILALVFVGQFTTMLDFLLEETQYSNTVTNWQAMGDDGTNPLRVLVNSVPAILSLLGYKWIKKEDDPVINLATNASIITAALSLVSMGTSGIYVGRLPIYVSLWSNSILLPWEIEKLFNKESARIMKMVTVGCYIVFFYYQMHFSWNLL